MDGLFLDLDGIKLKMWIKNYESHRKGHVDYQDWCNVSFEIWGENITYNVSDDEMLMCDEVDEIIEKMQLLIKNNIAEYQILSFLEPNLEFRLHPATKNADVQVDWIFKLWNLGTLTENYFSLSMDREDVEMFIRYLLEDVVGKSNP